MFKSKNETIEEYPLQDYRFMSLEELKYRVGCNSNEYRCILEECNKILTEYPFFLGV